MNWHLIYRIILIAAVAAAASAAELRLAHDAHPAGAITTLGDVLELGSIKPAELNVLHKVQLVPTPSPGQSRVLRRQEVVDLLARRGVDVRQVRIAGPATVTIHGKPPAAPSATGRATVNGQAYLAVSAVKQHLVDATLKHIARQTSDNIQWQIDLAPNTHLFRQLQTLQSTPIVSGGASPWTGQQQFTVQAATAEGTISVEFTATVTRPRMVVVTTRAMANGEIVDAGSVELRPAKNASVSRQAAASLEQVVGLQTSRSLAPNQAVLASYVRPVRLVRRGDIVNVFVRTSGFQIRTNAKALGDGAKHDLIVLQSTLDRNKKFTARVVGPREVEVFTGGEPPVQATTTPTVADRTAARAQSGDAVDTTQHSVFALEVRPQATARR